MNMNSILLQYTHTFSTVMRKTGVANDLNLKYLKYLEGSVENGRMETNQI